MANDSVRKLEAIDWDFEGENTTFLTHSIHPYPAKFIPQIPATVIEELSEPGDLVFDPFIGSGTTLVEALRANRRALGSDVNPMSALLAKVKATPLSEEQVSLIDPVLDDIRREINSLYGQESITDFGGDATASGYEDYIPDYKKLDFWFESFIIDELAIIKKNIHALDDAQVRDFLRIAMSAIIITVSKQDSDTRYTRREKDLQEQDALRKFVQKTRTMVRKMQEYREELETTREPEVRIADARDLSFLEEDEYEVDLVVTSPPYPNALSYHLYHRNRLVWLDFDYEELKPKEIGSHRKYSKKKGGANADTFRKEMTACLNKLGNSLTSGGYCVFVVGDSIIDGEIVKNNEIVKEAGQAAGLNVVADINRTIEETSKAVNPDMGSIKEERVVILQNDE